MRNRFIKGLELLAERDPHLFLLTGDLGFGVLTTFSERFPDRFINAGISEQNMAAVAAGLALEGNTVYLYSISTFPTMRCLEQIRNDICYHDADVKIISAGAGLAYGQLGMSHHATEDIAVMRALPNMRVFAPADAMETSAILDTVSHIKGPCYIRLEKNSAHDLHPTVPVRSALDTVVLSRGHDVTIFTAGSILEEAIAASGHLKKQGLSVGVCSVPCIKPLDGKIIAGCAESSRLIVTMEEHNVIGGLGGAVAELLSGLPSHAPLLRIGMADTYSSIVGSQRYLREYYHLDGASTAMRIVEYLETQA